MEKLLSIGLASKLNFLKLTRNGKINLSVFEDKILYKGLGLLQRTHAEIPVDAYNVYYAYCMLEAMRLNIPPQWDKIKDVHGFNPEAGMTADNQKFDMKKCTYFMSNATKIKPQRGASSSNYTNCRSKYGPTFNQGLTYWKYGKKYLYPDQAIDGEPNPCREDPTYIPPLSQDDDSRFDIDQVEQLKKAIRSGDINKKGLSFLKSAYVGFKPELVEIIDAYMAGCLGDEPEYGLKNLPF